MSKEERFELSCCLFNESNMDFIRDKKTNEEYIVLDELVPILNQQYQQIADLEAKLAESEETINNLEQQCLICNKDKENERLKQQLAEKDKWLRATDNHIKQLKEKEQDKISFCIEQLEKVKEKIADFEYEDIFYFDKFIEYIDNQIKQLTHQHEDKGE